MFLLFIKLLFLLKTRRHIILIILFIWDIYIYISVSYFLFKNFQSEFQLAIIVCVFLCIFSSMKSAIIVDCFIN